MKVLHVVSGLSADVGGATRAALAVVAGLRRRGIECMVCGSQPRDVVPAADGLPVQTFRVSPLSRVWTGYSWDCATVIHRSVRSADLIHIHELWHFPHFCAWKSAISHRKPYVVTVHGCLEPWAMRRKGPAKSLYLRFIQRRILREAAAIQALTGDEEMQIERVGVHTGRTFVIPNGIDPASFTDIPDGIEFDAAFPVLQGKKVILFMGRLHPKKGLEALAEAFSIVLRALDEEVFLVVVGPDEGGHEERVREVLRQEGTSDRAIFTGRLEGRRKWAALSRADVFVLPSLSEGLSLSVLEALAAGLPVVITPQCYLPEVGRQGAGLVVDGAPEPIAAALVRILRSQDLRRQMASNARKLITESYLLEGVVSKIVRLYEFALTSRSMEANVLNQSVGAIDGTRLDEFERN